MIKLNILDVIVNQGREKYEKFLNSHFINYRIEGKTDEEIITDAILRAECEEVESSCCIYNVGEIVTHEIPGIATDPIRSKRLEFYSLNDSTQPAYIEKISCFIYPVLTNRGDELRSSISGKYYETYHRLYGCLKGLKDKCVLMDYKLPGMTKFGGCTTAYNLIRLPEDAASTAMLIRVCIKETQLRLLNQLLENPGALLRYNDFEELKQEFTPVIQEKIKAIQQG